jgi:hypothetical protein
MEISRQGFIEKIAIEVMLEGWVEFQEIKQGKGPMEKKSVWTQFHNQMKKEEH